MTKHEQMRVQIIAAEAARVAANPPPRKKQRSSWPLAPAIAPARRYGPSTLKR